MRINHPELHGYSAQLVPIGDGADGIHATTRIMAKIVAQYEKDPDLIARAISIVQLAPPKDEPAEIRALFDFVRQNIRYVGDVAKIETVRTPDVTLKLRAGDCDDKSVLLASLLRALKYEAVFVVAGYSAPNVYEHVYVGVPDDSGGYLALDPSEDFPMGGEGAEPIAMYVEPIP